MPLTPSLNQSFWVLWAGWGRRAGVASCRVEAGSGSSGCFHPGSPLVFCLQCKLQLSW